MCLRSEFDVSLASCARQSFADVPTWREQGYDAVVSNVFEANFMKSEEVKPYLKAQSDQFRAVLTAAGLAK